MFASCRANKVEDSSLFVKIVNRYFDRQQGFFWQCQFRSFDGGSVRIKGEETVYNTPICQSGRIFCLPLYRNKCLPLASEEFVLASESN